MNKMIKVKSILKVGITSILITCFLMSCKGNQNNVTLSSADGNYVFSMSADEESGLTYRIDWNNESLVTKSALGFEVKDGRSFPKDVKIESVEKKSVDKNWKPLFGEQNEYIDKYNEILIKFSSKSSATKHIALRVRAYNEGVAFRYEFDQKDTILIDSELTEFSFKGDPTVWVAEQTQSLIHKLKLSELTESYERPLLAEISDSLYVALGEAALTDFAAMKFVKKKGNQNILLTELQDTFNGKPAPVNIPGGGYNSPWRYVMAGRSPSSILQNNFLLLNLNEENKLSDVSYIKPGKAIREVTLSTVGAKACIDFAVKHNLQYIMFDGGWYGNPWDDASDARTVTPYEVRSAGPLDLKEVIAYGKENGIGVIMYVDHRELEIKLDELLALYKSWGVVGVKFGFINVGSQKWTTWLYDAVKKAANLNLMIDVHDNYRPTGYSRTYPNLITQEGIRGDEESVTNDVVISTVFTRMIAGAGDQTNCYFEERVNNMGSHASQMAKSICIYSPWQFLYWYDRPEGSPAKKGAAGDTMGVIKEIPDLSFYDKLPTVWDETKIIDGYPEEFAIIARRKADSWFLGAITGISGKDVSLKLDFLETGKKYQATVYSDDYSLNSLTNVKIRSFEVTDSTVLEYKILKQNGLAIIFTPVD